MPPPTTTTRAWVGSFIGAASGVEERMIGEGIRA
jgi:hypothetical protein